MIHKATFQQNNIQLIIKRHFAVKELSWCAPKSHTLNKKKNGLSNQSPPSSYDNGQCKSCIQPNTIIDLHSTKQSQSFQFGIVAAMNQDRIIGVDGKIPWTIPEDRMHFERLTCGKDLVIGRKTFYERGNDDFSHIAHCRNVIVVSTTMNPNEVNDGEMQPKIHVVPSFDEAVQLAINLPQDHSAKYSTDNNDTNDIYCWVGGGQRIYEAAIRNPMAEEIHLTCINTPIERDDLEPNIGGKHFSFFPAKYRYDNVFEEKRDLCRDGKQSEPNLFYSFHVFKKKKNILNRK